MKMRSRYALLSFIIALSAHAQNWALLNPAYKYNYSLGGTDTITNQIFVTHIDTLGVDSFRYELNRIGVVCDTCLASLGGPCDGCFVRTNQPQFLGLSCIRSGSDWYFNGPDTFLIRSPVSIGAAWTFNSNNGVTAIVDAEWPASVFNTQDTLRRILLSDGDTVVLSRSYGMLRFPSTSEDFDLTGVEGAGVGRLFPDPLSYFDYQPGDQLIYKVTSLYWVTYDFGPTVPLTLDRYWMAVITGRTETTDTVAYTTSVALTYPINPPGSSLGALFQEPNWPIPLDHWSFNRAELVAHHPILAAYPGQILDTSICWLNGSADYDARYIANSGITSDGRTIMRSQSLGLAGGDPTSGFNAAHEVAAGVFPFLNQELLNVWYEEGIGIRRVEFKISWVGTGELSVQLVGAIIGGDTIVQPPAIDWDVGMQEDQRRGFNVSPNPANDRLFVQCSGPVHFAFRVLDITGQLLKTGTLIPDPHQVIDVSSLPEGMYLLNVTTAQGSSSQRFVIAR